MNLAITVLIRLISFTGLKVYFEIYNYLKKRKYDNILSQDQGRKFAGIFSGPARPGPAKIKNSRPCPADFILYSGPAEFYLLRPCPARQNFRNVNPARPGRNFWSPAQPGQAEFFWVRSNPIRQIFFWTPAVPAKIQALPAKLRVSFYTYFWSILEEKLFKIDLFFPASEFCRK